MSITTFAQLKPQSTHELWPNYLATGQLTLLAGPPASGKTALCLHLAAQLSRGLPITPPHPPMNNEQSTIHNPQLETRNPKLETPPLNPVSTLLLCFDDHPAASILPRLQAENADLARIYISDYLQGHDDLAQCIDQTLRSFPDIKLIIIDTIGHCFPFTAPNLLPLAQVAQDQNVAILLTTHLKNDPSPKRPPHQQLQRMLGNLSHTPRTIHLLLSDALPSIENQKSKIENLPAYTLLPLKSPHPTLPAPFTLVRTSTGALTLTAPSEPSSFSIHNSSFSIPRDLPLQGAQTFLQDLLAEGPLLVTKIKLAAMDNLITLRTLERAKAALHIRSFRSSRDDPWYWRLPQDTRQPPDPLAKQLAVCEITQKMKTLSGPARAAAIHSLEKLLVGLSAFERDTLDHNILLQAFNAVGFSLPPSSPRRPRPARSPRPAQHSPPTPKMNHE